jgi:hypothetical protein
LAGLVILIYIIAHPQYTTATTQQTTNAATIPNKINPPNSDMFVFVLGYQHNPKRASILAGTLDHRRTHSINHRAKQNIYTKQYFQIETRHYCIRPTKIAGWRFV